MGDVILAQAAACFAPVVQPFVQHLVAANGVLPHTLAHVGKAATGVDEHLAHIARQLGQGFTLLCHLLQTEISAEKGYIAFWTCAASYYFCSIRMFQQMPLHQLAAQLRQRIEQSAGAWNGDSREVCA